MPVNLNGMPRMWLYRTAGKLGAAVFLALCWLAACTTAPSARLDPPDAPPQGDHSPAAQTSGHLPSGDLRFERLGIEDGLSHSAVWKILQDSEGYMWFGTQDGLNRFDGYTFTVYRHNPEDPLSLKDDYISAIYEDRSGVLWVGTQKGWLHELDRDQDRFIPHQIGSWVTAVYEDRSGVMWVGAQGGLYTFDRESGEASLVTSERGWVEAIHETRSGELWLGTEDGWLSTLDRPSRTFTDYRVTAAPTSILEDGSGALWLGTYCDGLVRFHPQAETFTYFRHDPDDDSSLSDSQNCVLSIAEGDPGTLWVASGNGLNRLDLPTGRFSRHQHDSGDPYSLSAGGVLSVYQDRSGALWVGVSFGGINKLAAGAGRFTHYRHLTDDPDSLSGNIVTSVTLDEEGDLWIGTFGGLDRLDRTSGQWTHYPHDPDIPGTLAHSVVRSLYVDRVGTLWVGTDGGLDRYDREGNAFVHYTDSPVVMWMHEGSSSSLWLATKDGLHRLDRETDSLTFLKSVSAWTVTVLEDQSGVVWVGTSGDGLYRYDPTTGEWRHYGHDPGDPLSLAHGFVEAVHEDVSGTLWLATGGGLDRFDRETGTFAHYGVQHGLASRYVRSVVQEAATPGGEAGSLWLATEGGLSRFDPRTETFTNYYASDGLQSNLFWRNAYYQSPDGEMFFGGQNGLTAFHPEQVIDNPHPPPIVVTAFSLDNRVVRTHLSADERIELGHRSNFLSFDYAALDYNNPHSNQYAYWMEGLEEDWVQAGERRHADYPNLRPGNYVFHVKGSNNDGVWNEQGASLRITITPPFWRTWWFGGLLLLTLVGGAYGAYRVRVRTVEARSRELERQVIRRTAELENANELLAQERAEAAVAEERTRLARELHDAVTQTLFSASLLAEALPGAWETDRVEGRQLLTDIRQLYRGALAEMRSLLHELRPRTISDTALDDLLRQLGEAVAGRERIAVDVQADGECDLPSEVHVALYRIAQESLNNVVKHARASAVTIKLGNPAELGLPASTVDAAAPDTNRQIALVIQDDGRGFDIRRVRSEAMGLGIMRERAEAIGAVLRIDSRPGEGTQIEAVWRDTEAATDG